MPLTSAEESELAALEAELLQEQGRKEARQQYSWQAVPPPEDLPKQRRELLESEQEARALRYGVPLMLSAAFPPAGIVSQALLGAAYAGGGETGAQAVESAKQGKEYRLGDIAGAAFRGAAPVFKGAPVKTTLVSGGAGVLGGAAEGKIPATDMSLGGALETGIGALKEFGASAVPVGLLQGAAGALGANRARLTGGITRSEAIERMAPGQVTATFGQAFPYLAGLEARVASQTGSQELTQQLTDQARAIARAIQTRPDLAGIPAEAHSDLVSRVAQTIAGLSPETGARLANEAQQVNDAFVAVNRARSEAQKSVAIDALKDAQKSFQQSVEMETLKGGFKTGAITPYQIIPAGQRVEGVVNQARQAIRAEANRLYGPANAVEDVPAFDLYQGVGNQPSFADRANEILSKIPDIHLSTLTDIRRILGRKTTVAAPPSGDPTAPLTMAVPQKATFKEIKTIRDELYDFADYSGEAIGKDAQREIRNLAGSLSGTVTDQAPQALGQKVADSIKAGEEFYGATRPKVDFYGVKRAFIPETMKRGQMGESAVSGVAAQGIQAPEFANLESLINTLQSRKVANAPSMQPIIDDIRSGIVDRSIDKATGQLNLNQLASDLNNIAQQGGGGIQKLGFGSQRELNRFVRYMQELPEAQTRGPEAVLKLLQTGTPAGYTVASKAVQLLPDLATVDSVMQALQRQAAGGSKIAENTLMQIRAREIENLLLEGSKTGPKPNLGSLIELTDPEMRSKVQLILGPKLLKTIDDVFMPGYRVMEEARQAAGMAGSTVRGAALERVGRAVAEVPVEMAKGEVLKPAANVFSKLSDTLGYAVMSRVLAKGAGASGLRDRKQFYGFLKQIAEKPQPQQIQLVRRYIGEDQGE